MHAGAQQEAQARLPGGAARAHAATVGTCPVLPSLARARSRAPWCGRLRLGARAGGRIGGPGRPLGRRCDSSLAGLKAADAWPTTGYRLFDGRSTAPQVVRFMSAEAHSCRVSPVGRRHASRTRPAQSHMVGPAQASNEKGGVRELMQEGPVPITSLLAHHTQQLSGELRWSLAAP